MDNRIQFSHQQTLYRLNPYFSNTFSYSRGNCASHSVDTDQVITAQTCIKECATCNEPRNPSYVSFPPQQCVKDTKVPGTSRKKDIRHKTVSQVWFLTLDCRTSERAQIINRFGCSPDAQTFSAVSLQRVGQHRHCTPRAPHSMLFMMR